MKRIFGICFLICIIFIFVGCGQAPVVSGLLDYYIVYEDETSDPIFFQISGVDEQNVDFQSLSLDILEVTDNRLVGLKAGPALLQVSVRNSDINQIIPVYVVSPYNYLSQNDEVTIVEYLGSKKETLVIPKRVYTDSENGYAYKTVTGIADDFYTKSKLEFKSITLPETIKNIGRYAFANNDTLEEVVMPFDMELTEFSEGVFSNLSKLSTINIPNKLAAINTNAFKDTELIDFKIEDNEHIVYDDNLLIDYNTSTGKGIVIYANPLSNNFTVPEDVELISAFVFLDHKNIKAINLKNVRFIGMEAFKNSTLETIISNLEFSFDKDAFLNTPYYDNLIN